MQPSRTSSLVHLLIVALASVAGVSQSASKPSAVAQARAQVARGQLDDAEKNLWSVLSANPNEPEALTLLGIIRGRQKRYGEAEALFRHVLEINSKSEVARRNLASALIAEDKADAAMEQYQKLVELAPRDNAARVELAQLYLAKGQFRDAVAILDQIPQGRLPIEAVPVKAAGLLGVGKRQDAAALIPSAAGSASVEADLAEVFLDANAPDLASQAVDEAFAHSQHPSARLYALRGRVQEAQGHADAALRSFNAALARDPKSVENMVALAALEALQGKHQESFVILKRAYKLQPDSPGVLRPLVVESVKAGQPETAVRAAHALVQASPENLDDLYLAGAAMLEGEDYASAVSIYEKYVSKRGADAKGFLGLGIAELGEQHYPQAKTALERALQIDPSNADAEYQLGVIADQQGSSREARQHLERAIGLQPNHANALAKLGELYLQTGELEKAQQILQHAVAADSKNSKAQYDYALVLAKLGKNEEAKQHMDRARALQAAEDAGKIPHPPTP